MINVNTSNQDNSVKGVLKENNSLGRGGHVRQVPLDRQQATVPIKNSLKIGTWNVRTMFQKGKLDNIKNEMERMKINALGLSEVRWLGAGSFTTDNFLLLYSGGDKHERGVGMLLDKETSKSLQGFWAVSDRVLLVKLHSKPFNTSLIQCYAPTADYDDDAITNFYEDLDKAYKQCKSDDIIYVMGDFNAKVGDKRIGNTVGPFGLGNKNDRGDNLITWCQSHNLVITNTWFKNHPRRLWTWQSPGDRARNQIDYIMVPHRFRNSIIFSKAFPGADCGSDHVPVISKIRVKLKRIKQPQKNIKLQVHILKADRNLREQFRIKVQNRFEALDQITQTEVLWEQMKSSILTSAEEIIPKTQLKKKKRWMTNEILQLMEQRRLKKSNPHEYQLIDKSIKKKCSEAKEKWLNEQCSEIENKLSVNTKFAHQKINEITGKSRCTSSGCIKSKNGTVLMEKGDILNRWSEYIEELFDDNRASKPNIKKNIEGPPIMKGEVRLAIKSMKTNKATGPDGISIEMIQCLDELGVDVMTKLINKIYDTGEIPEDLTKSIFIALPKKPGATECELHRTISLMSHITKVLLKILMMRMKNKITPEIAKEQYGFMPDKGTRNAIFILRMIIERSIEVKHDLYLCFLDYTKAFDKVKHDSLFQILEKLDIDGKDLQIIRNIYWDQKAAIRIKNDTSDYTSIKRGVRQGCVLSPDLFNIYSEMILRNLEDVEGIKIGGNNCNNIRYADDTVLMASNEQDLQKMIDIVSKESIKMGLSLNIKKTECMCVSKSKIIPTCKVYINREPVKQVNRFHYLGSIITSDGRCDEDIKMRIALSKQAFQKMSPVLKNRTISIDTKTRVLKCYVWSILLYGSECWTISKEMEKRLEATEMWFLRRMLNVPWTARETNESILKRTKSKRFLINTIRYRQLKFLGHIIRKGCLEHLVLSGKIKGKKDKGRPRIKYLENVNLWIEKQGYTKTDFLHAAQDRKNWRIMLANVCNR
jgi:exonuclease III